MKIARVEPMILHIPFYAEHVTAAMHRAHTHDERVLVIRVEVVDGTVGFGDRTVGFHAGLPDPALLERRPLSAVMVGSGHAAGRLGEGGGSVIAAWLHDLQDEGTSLA